MICYAVIDWWLILRRATAPSLCGHLDRCLNLAAAESVLIHFGCQSIVVLHPCVFFFFFDAKLSAFSFIFG
jgi:hypothetical protein